MEKPNHKTGKRQGWLRRLAPRMSVFLAGILFAVLCFVGLNLAMEPVSHSNYCGGQCHEMKTSFDTWQLSGHGANKDGYRVECVDCHLPPKDQYFTHMTAKAYAGAKDILKHYFGPPYDVEKLRSKVLAHIPNDTCTHCHDDLLRKPGSTAARTAHLAVATEPDRPEHRCVECHENVGHERHNTLFSPDK